MIISDNPVPPQQEFDQLLIDTLAALNELSRQDAGRIARLGGSRLEPFVKEVMDDLATNTHFEGSIELVSGQRFPDIIANRYYGVEVKSTTENHWRTTGNSVLESTRVAGVERIHLMFGKLADPIEFRCRPYQECLSEVVVTHSPRYLIDMNLREGSTIFDKIGMAYDELRQRESPLTCVVDYYKSRLKPGQELWWIEKNDSSKSTSLIVRIWNTLSSDERRDIKIRSMALFPEVFSNNSDKFNRLALWLVTDQSIVCPNIRDVFTARGRVDLTVNEVNYYSLPRIFNHLYENRMEIAKFINDTDSDELSAFWKLPVTETDKFALWHAQVTQHSLRLPGAQQLNIEVLLRDMFSFWL